MRRRNTARASRVLGDETGMTTDTVAKLLYEWDTANGSRGRAYRLPHGSTVVIDEAGMLGTADLHALVQLAERNSWRLALVGDPRQLSSVGRGGMVDELCATSRVVELQQVHRFNEPWEAAASLGLRRGDLNVLSTYDWHDRGVAAPLAEHVDAIADRWMATARTGRTLAVTTTTNSHVDLINEAIQRLRLDAGHLRPDERAELADGHCAFVGDMVATRRNDRRLRTDRGEPVRNRDRWTVAAIGDDGRLSLARLNGAGTVSIPVDYARADVRLGCAATEYGQQSVTTDESITLATGAMNARGLYVGMTRGRHDNTVHVVTETHDRSEALDALERILTNDPVEVAAVSHRRQLASQDRTMTSRSKPVERCAVPTVFGELLREARHEANDVRRLIEVAPARRRELAAALDDAKAKLTVAERRHSPFAAAVQVALDTHNEARQAMYGASKDLRDSKAVTRRGARRRLHEAEAAVEMTSAALDRVRAAAKPTASPVYAAQDAARQARHGGDLERQPVTTAPSSNCTSHALTPTVRSDPASTARQ